MTRLTRHWAGRRPDGDRSGDFPRDWSNGGTPAVGRARGRRAVLRCKWALTDAAYRAIWDALKGVAHR